MRCRGDLTILAALLVGCTGAPVEAPCQVAAAREATTEQTVQLLPLAGDLADRHAETSGFAWYGDRLIVLPQRPTWNPAHGPQGCFYTLERAALERAVDGDPTPLEGRPLPLRGFQQVAGLPGVQGFEAIALQGDRVFLLIEAQSRDKHMRGYLALGHIEGALTSVVIDSVSTIELPAQTGVDNLAYEAMVTTPTEVMAIYEANGALNPSPYSLRLDPEGRRVEPVAFPHLEYRVTDATPPGPQGRFWAINYFYPPELALSVPLDPLSARFGLGPTQRPGGVVERLVPMQLDHGRVSLVPEPPVRLRLQDDRPRNWEALAVLPGRGFLLATDRYPASELGFVAYPSP